MARLGLNRFPVARGTLAVTPKDRGVEEPITTMLGAFRLQSIVQKRHRRPGWRAWRNYEAVQQPRVVTPPPVHSSDFQRTALWRAQWIIPGREPWPGLIPRFSFIGAWFRAPARQDVKPYGSQMGPMPHYPFVWDVPPIATRPDIQSFSGR